MESVKDLDSAPIVNLCRMIGARVLERPGAKALLERNDISTVGAVALASYRELYFGMSEYDFNRWC